MSIEMPVSEIADRYSICLLKSERTSENMDNELKYYSNELKHYPNIKYYIDRLYNINGEIWDLESDIRRGKEREMGWELVGKRAVEIRDKNKIRVSIKNEMVEFYKQGFKDIKINHAST